jgi:hypothetical protein
MLVVERDDPTGVVSETERRRRDHALHESGAASRSIRETIVKVSIEVARGRGRTARRRR